MSIFRTQKSAIFRRSVTTGLVGLAALAVTSCGVTQVSSTEESEDRTISLIVTESAPYQEPTEIARELLKEDGWELETTYVTDIVQPKPGGVGGRIRCQLLPTSGLSAAVQ